MRLAREYAPAALVLVAGLLAWEAVVYVFSIQFYLLPAPHVIVQSLRETYPLLVEAGVYTFTEAIVGWALGCGGGVLAGPGAGAPPGSAPLRPPLPGAPAAGPTVPSCAPRVGV